MGIQRKHSGSSGLKRRLQHKVCRPLSITMAACLIASMGGGAVVAAGELDESLSKVTESVITVPYEEAEKQTADGSLDQDYGPWNDPDINHEDSGPRGPWEDPDLKDADDGQTGPGYGPWNGPGSEDGTDDDQTGPVYNPWEGADSNSKPEEPDIYILDEDNGVTIVNENDGLLVISPNPDSYPMDGITEDHIQLIPKSEDSKPLVDEKQDLLTTQQYGKDDSAQTNMTVLGGADFAIIEAKNETNLAIGTQVQVVPGSADNQAPKTGDWQNVSAAVTGMVTSVLGAGTALASLLKRKKRKN